MQRDMELIRRILLAVESGELLSDNYHARVLTDVPTDLYFYHVWVLSDAGYLKSVAMRGDNHQLYYPVSLTWSGHEFLDTVRHDSVWDKIKMELGPQISTVPLQVIAGLGLAALKSKFHLQ